MPNTAAGSETKSSFLEILNSWPDYFENMDEGLGTTYERVILHNYFELIKNQFQIESILEAPAFGMTGVSNINSLWWAQQGITPLVLDDNPERVEKSAKVWAEIPLNVNIQHVNNFDSLPLEDQSIDASWNFAALWFVNDVNDFFSELNRVTRKVIFICVPNNYGIGYQLRSHFNETNLPGFKLENILPKKILSAAKTQNWKIWKKGYLDIPPWPDIAMKKEVLFKKLGLSFLLKKNTQENGNERTCIVDYFNGTRPDLDKEILKYNYLEKAPTPVKQIWGHHRYYIFTK